MIDKTANRNGHQAAPPSQAVPLEASLGAYVPPQATEAEQATLGCMMLDPECIGPICEALDASDFYRPVHQDLYTVIKAMTMKRQPIDLLTLKDELTSRGKLESVGGVAYLMAIYDAVPTTANFEYYASLVRSKATLRRLIAAAMEVIVLARTPSDDIDAVVDQACSVIGKVSEQRGADDGERLQDVLLRINQDAEERGLAGGGMTGISCGIDPIDGVTGGLQRTDLILIAGRPGMGKSALAVTMAEYVAGHEPGTVAIFSLEMSNDQLGTRMLTGAAEVNSQVFRRGLMDEDEAHRLSKESTRLYDARMRMFDASGVTPSQIRAKCRRMQQKEGLSLIVIDYLGLMQADKPSGNEVQDLTAIAQELKNMARDFKVPVIALSQLSRLVEGRPNKKPMMSDLRGSGAIEAAADVIILLFREAYYKAQQVFEATGAQPAANESEIAEAIFGKHRNGPTGVVNLTFMPKFARFMNRAPLVMKQTTATKTKLPYRDDDEPTGF